MDKKEEESTPQSTAESTDEMLPLLRILVDLKKHSKELKVEGLRLPYFVTMGMQSSGKTLFIEWVLKLAVGFTCANIGTRCPVEYLLRHSNNSEVRVMVDSKDIPVGDVPNTIKRHMEIIESKDKISKDVLQVCIESRDVPDFVFVDLPGFNVEREESTAINELAMSYMRKKETFVLGVVKATESVESNSEIQRLLDMCNTARCNPNEKMLILVNKIDAIYSAAWVHQNALDSLLVSPKAQISRFMFMTLNPEQSDLDRMHPSERTKHAKMLERKEKEWLERHIEPLVRDKAIMKKHFYLSNIFHAALSRRLISLSEQIAQIKGLNVTMDDNQLTLHIKDCIGTFASHVVSIVTMTQVPGTSHNKTVPMPEERQEYLTQHYATRLDEDLATLQCTDISWSYLMGVDEAVAHMERNGKGVFLASTMREPAIGRAAFLRAKQLIVYSTLAHTEQAFSDARIRDWFHSGQHGLTDVIKAVTEMVKTQVSGCKDGILVFNSILLQLCERYSAVVLNEMIEGEAADGAVNVDLWTDIQEAFMSYVSECLDAQQRRWEESVRLYSDCVPMDISTKTLLFLLNCTMEDVIVDETQRKEPIITDRSVKEQILPTTSPVSSMHTQDPVLAAVARLEAACVALVQQKEKETQEKKQEKKQEEEEGAEAKEEASSENGASSEMDKNVKSAEPQAWGQRFYNCMWPAVHEELTQLLGGEPANHDVHRLIGALMANEKSVVVEGMRTLVSRSEQAKLNEKLSDREKASVSQRREVERRAIQKMSSFRKVRDCLRELSSSFVIADIVEGGFQAPYHQTAAHINYDYIRAVAKEYYYMMLTRFLFDFDANYMCNVMGRLDHTRIADIIINIERRLHTADDNTRPTEPIDVEKAQSSAASTPFDRIVKNLREKMRKEQADLKSKQTQYEATQLLLREIKQLKLSASRKAT